MEIFSGCRKRTMGKVTLYILMTRIRKKLLLRNWKDDYDKAIDAHAHGSHVEIVGELKSGRNATITCESFSIIN